MWNRPELDPARHLMEEPNMELFTRQEAARKLRIGLRTLDRRIAEGKLECHRLGEGPRAPVRISAAQIQAYLASTAAGPRTVLDRRRAERILRPHHKPGAN